MTRWIVAVALSRDDNRPLDDEAGLARLSEMAPIAQVERLTSRLIMIVLRHFEAEDREEAKRLAEGYVEDRIANNAVRLCCPPFKVIAQEVEFET